MKSIRLDAIACFSHFNGWELIFVSNPWQGSRFLQFHQLKTLALELALVPLSNTLFGKVAFSFGRLNWSQTHGGNGQGGGCGFCHHYPEKHNFVLSSLLPIDSNSARWVRSQQMCKLLHRRFIVLHIINFNEDACFNFPTTNSTTKPLVT